MERKDKIDLGVIAFIAVGLFIILLFPLSDARTIILKTPSGTDSCVEDFVLAQNMTDLCDVTIIDPLSSQIIEYNGTQWVNVNATTFTDTTVCNNLGSSGTIICAGGNVDLKRLMEGVGITLSNNATHIQITNSLPENTVCDNQVTGTGLCINDTVELKNLVAGSNISISSNSTHITISTSGVVTESTICSNTGSGLSATLCNGGNVNIKGLIESTGIDLVNNTNDVTIKTKFSNGTGISITGSTTQTFTNTGVISNQCDKGINCSGTNPSILNTDFVNGTGISITGTTSQIFTNTGVISNSCSLGIICSGTNPSSITPNYQLLCKTTLVSSNATIFCGTFTGHKTIIIHMQALSTGGTGIEPAWRFNSDGGNNYAMRVSSNGAADATVTSTSRCNLVSSGTLIVSTNGIEAQGIVYDMLSSDRKLVVGTSTNGINSSAGTAPNRNEFSCKWDNSSSLITSVTAIINTGTGSYNTNSQLTVWGYD